MKKDEELREWPTEEEFAKEEQEDNASCDCGCDDCIGCESKEETCDCGCCEDEEDECGCSGCCGDCSGCGCEDEEYIEEPGDLANLYLQMAQRVQADFDNYRRRNEGAIEKAKKDGKISVISSILPCADAIDKAIQLTQDENVKKGLLMVDEKFQSVLSGLGVTKMKTIGEVFDANFHNALSTMPSDKPSGTIIEEYQCGYKMGDDIIRFPQVIVSK